MNMEIKKFVEKNLDLMLAAGDYLWKNPEAGFKEYKTDAYMKNAFKKLGYDITEAEGITGFYTTVDTGRKGPTLLVLAEMDALYCFNHPDRDKETGAVHACGHCAQMAMILGLAACLKEKDILKNLCGKIKLCVVPAEEGIDISYRMQLKEQGKIKYLAGKQEFIYRGYFDDVDIAFMLHATVMNDNLKCFTIKQGANGIIMKEIKFIGKAAHAGGSPDKGINALNAASLAIQAVGLLRETFKEKDYIRFHPIITKGGDVVNAVPAEVVMESYVRSSNIEALKQVNEKINFAISSAAAAVGASVEINDCPGYAPLINDKKLSELALQCFREVSGENGYFDDTNLWNTGSTDMGDISCLLPSIHPYVAGAKGMSHGKDYFISEPEKMYHDGLALELTLLEKLLQNNAKKANEIIEAFKPIFKTKEEYFDYMDKQNAKILSSVDYINGKIILSKQ